MTSYVSMDNANATYTPLTWLSDSGHRRTFSDTGDGGWREYQHNEYPADVKIDQPHLPHDDEPKHSDSARIWSMYLSQAEKFDKDLVESWKGDMDAQLIFAGLFSAVITAFLVESYKQLPCDISDPQTALLALMYNDAHYHGNATMDILQQDACGWSNSGTFTNAVAETVNALWFLSLVFALACALAATLVQQWSRTYIQGTRMRSIPHERARSRTYFFEGVTRYHVSGIVEAIPLLLHAALFLFFTGLVVFLFPIDKVVAIPVLIVVAVFVLTYVSLTVIPAFDFSCPYKTPLSSIIWYAQIGRHTRSLRQQDKDAGVANYQPRLALISLSRPYDEDGHLEKSDLDPKALHWTMQWLANDTALEPFVAAIPELLQFGPRVEDNHSDVDPEANPNLATVQRLFFGSEMQARRVANLLATCHSYPTLTPSEQERRMRRAIACLRVILMVPNPTVNHVTSPELWPAFVVQYFRPIVREVSVLKQESEPSEEVRDLAHRTFAVLARRAITNYRAYLREVNRIIEVEWLNVHDRQKHLPAYRNALQRILYGEHLEGPLKDLLSSSHYGKGSSLQARLISLTNPELRISTKVQRLKDGLIKPAAVNHQTLFEDSKQVRDTASLQLTQVKGCLCAFVLFHVNDLMDVHAGKNDVGGINPAKYDIISDTLRYICKPVAWTQELPDEDKVAVERTLTRLVPEHPIPGRDDRLPLPLPFIHIIIPFVEDLLWNGLVQGTSLVNPPEQGYSIDADREHRVKVRIEDFYTSYPDIPRRRFGYRQLNGQDGVGQSADRRGQNIRGQTISTNHHHRESVSMLPPTRGHSVSE